MKFSLTFHFVQIVFKIVIGRILEWILRTNGFTICRISELLLSLTISLSCHILIDIYAHCPFIKLAIVFYFNFWSREEKEILKMGTDDIHQLIITNWSRRKKLLRITLAGHLVNRSKSNVGCVVFNQHLCQCNTHTKLVTCKIFLLQVCTFAILCLKKLSLFLNSETASEIYEW